MSTILCNFCKKNLPDDDNFMAHKDKCKQTFLNKQPENGPIKTMLKDIEEAKEKKLQEPTKLKEGKDEKKKGKGKDEEDDQEQDEDTNKDKKKDKKDKGKK